MVTLYLVILLALTAASVLFSVPILRLHHRPESRPITGLFASLIIFLRTLMCMGTHPDHDNDDDRYNDNDNVDVNNGELINGMAPRSTLASPSFEKPK